MRDTASSCQAIAGIEHDVQNVPQAVQRYAIT